MRAQAAAVPLTFVTGPVRAGKSRFAEALATEAGGTVVYVATAAHHPTDAEWQRRLAHHRARRPAAWQTIETAGGAASVLPHTIEAARADRTLLVDSLGTWLADRMAQRLALGSETDALDEDALEAEIGAVVAAAVVTRATLIVVGEEVGWGIVPTYPSGRVFRDVLGRAQQRLALAADRAYFVVAAHAIDLSSARPIPPGPNERG